ncbi:adipolin-like [Saccoglossus kowalevskii]
MTHLPTSAASTINTAKKNLSQETEHMSSGDYLDRNGYPEDDENDYRALPYSLATRTNDERSTSVDSRRTWIDFVRHHDRTNGKKEKKKGRDRSSVNGPPGPAGPVGPRGPPGPRGAEITKEDMMIEFKKMVKEAAEKRAERIIASQCPGCLNPVGTQNGTQVSAHYDWDDIEVIPRIPAAFHCKLQSNVDIAQKSLQEVTNFQIPFAGGAFKRGQGLDIKSGRFVAPRTAIYQFSANMHIFHRVPKKNKEGRKLRSRDNVRVLICINSLCHRHTSLEFISGLESNSRVFTVNVNGLLQLEAEQYASVYIDNSCSRAVSIQSGSDFTGIMIGV